MEIKIREFKCWNKLDLVFNKNSVTLIKGCSGAGKSTIFQAISWCLYYNIRSVAPNNCANQNKVNTSVSLKIPYKGDKLKIKRSKNPNILSLKYEGKKYEDKVAQSMIEDIFGKYEIWLNSSYIVQNCRNNFLTASNLGKMEYLNSIAFHHEDPSEYIEKIDAKIKTKESKYKKKSEILEKNCKILEEKLKKVDIEKHLSDDQYEQIKSQINDLDSKRKDFENDKLQRNTQMEILKNVKENIRITRQKLDNIKYPNVNLDKIKKVDELIININENQGRIDPTFLNNIICEINENLPIIAQSESYIVEFEKIENEIKKIKFGSEEEFSELNSYDIEFLLELHDKILIQESEYEKNYDICCKNDVEYDKNSVDALILDYEDAINSQHIVKLLNEKEEMIKIINQTKIKILDNSVNVKIPELTENKIVEPDYDIYDTKPLYDELSSLSKELGNVQAHIEHSKNCQNVLSCPHCQKYVRIKNNKIIKSEDNPTADEDIEISRKKMRSLEADIKQINSEITQCIKDREIAKRKYDSEIHYEKLRIKKLQDEINHAKLQQQHYDSTKKSLEEKLDSLNLNLTKIEQSLQNFGNLSDISDIELLSENEIQLVKKIISQLSNITFNGPPKYKLSTIKSVISRKKLLLNQDLIVQKLDQLTLKIQYTYFKNIKTLSYSTLKNIHSYLTLLNNQLSNYHSEKDRLSTNLSDLELEFENLYSNLIPDPYDKIVSTETNISDLQNKLFLSDSASEVLKFHQELNEFREKLVTINNKIFNLNALKKNAIETECNMLQQVVDNINSCISEICEQIFDKEIDISLNLFKTIKTTKNTKPVVNFTICYQGCTFDNINQMSGGEGDRASLALTLALNKLSSCNFLMFDESLASINLDIKEKAIEAIRSNTGTISLIVMHDGVDGLFDDVIDVEELH